MERTQNSGVNLMQVRIQMGGGGAGGPDPPGKSQVPWVSIGNKQLDPPPPPPEKVEPPLES